MKVALIAHTDVTADFIDVSEELGFDRDPMSRRAEDLIEFAGRLCYESYHKPNEKTRANVDYLANVALQKHFSVFEHASATFLIRGVSRALTHELVRHRHFSFSQVSQRYVDSSGRGFVEHEALNMAHEDFLKRVEELRVQAACLYEVLVTDLVSSGYSRKEARGAARLVLPEGTTTDIVVTGNFRTWLEFIEKRDSKFADAEIRELAGEIKHQLQENFPNAFQDSIVNKEETRPEPVSIRPDSYNETYLQQIQEKINQALKDVFK